jgi:hypothetical protein
MKKSFIHYKDKTAINLDNVLLMNVLIDKGEFNIDFLYANGKCASWCFKYMSERDWVYAEILKNHSFSQDYTKPITDRI